MLARVVPRSFFPRITASALGLMGVVGIACTVQIRDFDGLACDAVHPCVFGTCVAGTCRTDAGSGAGGGGGGSGGTGGGGASGGTGGGAGGVESDAGQGWRQAAHGFVSQDVCPGCEVRTDAGPGNALLSSIVGGNPYAYANASAPASRLEPTNEGHVVGKIQALAPVKTGAGEWLGVFELTNARGDTVIALHLAPNNNVGFYASPGTLTAAQMWRDTTSPTTAAGLYAVGVDNTLEVTWKQGAFLKVSLNGAAFLDDTALAPGPDAGAAFPAALRLGVLDFSTTRPDAGTRFLFHDWKYIGSATAPF